MSDVEWPREIWMAEREDHDQGVVTAVLSEHATIARYEGDTERDREFHHYVDADIHESAERYYKEQINRMRGATVKRLEWDNPGSINNHCWTAKTVLGTYSVANEDGWYASLEDGMKWEWESPEDPRSYPSEHAAQTACQEHFDSVISSALEAA